MLTKRFHGILWIVALFAQLASAAEVLEVTTDHADAIYRKGETASFHISLKDGDHAIAGAELQYRIIENNVRDVSSGTIKSAEKAVDVKSTLDHPGLLRCLVTTGDKKLSASAGAAFDPLEIKPSLPVPDDFDAFWDSQKKLLADDPAKPILTPVKSSDANIEVFDVQVNCPGGAPLYGYLARPKKAAEKSLPAVVHPHSAGVRDSDLPYAIRMAKMGLIAFDFNAHGLPNAKGDQFYKDQLDGPLKSYASRGMDDREKNYFRGMYLRVMRAVDFVASQPQWDGKHLIATGSSQGGGQSLVAAGADHRVSLCLANVPALCDHTAPVVGRAAGWPRMLSSSNGKTDATATQTLRYVDAMNFASRIKCPTYVTVGLIDQTCAPASVYAAYNNIPGEKHILARPAMGHAFPPDLGAEFDRLIRQHIGDKR